MGHIGSGRAGLFVHWAGPKFCWAGPGIFGPCRALVGTQFFEWKISIELMMKYLYVTTAESNGWNGFRWFVLLYQCFPVCLCVSCCYVYVVVIWNWFCWCDFCHQIDVIFLCLFLFDYIAMVMNNYKPDCAVFVVWLTKKRSSWKSTCLIFVCIDPMYKIDL